MAKTTVKTLIGDLHERFGDELTSAEQQKLMQSLVDHAHAFDEAEPIDPNLVETLDLLVGQLEAEHPQAAGVVRKIVETLNNIGV